MKIKILLALLFAAALLGPARVLAHCDGLDGPVVKAAETALETGNVNFVLIWVQKKDQAEIIDAFSKARAVRKLSAEAQALADTYFFETLVRVHRAGEGAAYTGLKPAGRDLGAAIPAADQALATGSVKSLAELLQHAVEEGLQEHFTEVVGKKQFNKEDVEAGRNYVRLYVEFIHYVERIHDAAKSAAEGHYHEAEVAGAPHRSER